MVIGEWSPRLRDALTRGLGIGDWGIVVGEVFTHAKGAKPRQEPRPSRGRYGVETHTRGLVIGAVAWGPGAAHHLSGGTIGCRFARSLQNY